MSISRFKKWAILLVKHMDSNAYEFDKEHFCQTDELKVNALKWESIYIYKYSEEMMEEFKGVEYAYTMSDSNRDFVEYYVVVKGVKGKNIVIFLEVTFDKTHYIKMHEINNLGLEVLIDELDEREMELLKCKVENFISFIKEKSKARMLYLTEVMELKYDEWVEAIMKKTDTTQVKK